MSEVKIPTCGRMIHYFPIYPDFLKENNPDYCKMLPAIVVEASDLAVNMVVYSLASIPAKAEWSVQHLSCVGRNANGEPTSSYWDWPKIN